MNIFHINIVKGFLISFIFFSCLTSVHAVDTKHIFTDLTDNGKYEGFISHSNQQYDINTTTNRGILDSNYIEAKVVDNSIKVLSKEIYDYGENQTLKRFYGKFGANMTNINFGWNQYTAIGIIDIIQMNFSSYQDSQVVYQKSKGNDILCGTYVYLDEAFCANHGFEIGNYLVLIYKKSNGKYSKINYKLSTSSLEVYTIDFDVNFVEKKYFATLKNANGVIVETISVNFPDLVSYEDIDLSHVQYMAESRTTNGENQKIYPYEVGIDIVGGPIDYSNTSENNSNTYTSQNTYGTPYVAEETFLDFLNTENFQVADEQTQVSNDAGDPVRLETGEFEYDNTLMRIPSEGMDFSLDVMYRNRSYYNGPIGNNFDFGYNKYLREDENGNIYFHDGKLGAHRFEKQADGSFAYNAALDATLSLSGTTYEMLQNGKMTYSFGENKKLSSITDNYNNSMSFIYNENDELISIFDTQNREYIINYYDHSRIESIVDFTGNSVVFEYFEDGDIDGGEYDLQNIVLENSGEEKIISFTYTQSENFNDAHNIVKLIDSKGQTYVENTYQDNRVISQTYGNGTIIYNYTLSGSSVIGNQVTDRNGNITDYVFDTFGNTLSRTKDNITYAYEYNSDGKLITEIHPRGNGYSYDYDINGNLIEKRQKQDTSASDSSDDIVTSYEYDLTFNIPTKITLPNGLETTYTLDTSGNIISSSSSFIDSGNGTVIQTQSFDYNLLGQLTSSTDAYGLTTTYNYSESLLISQTRAGIQTESYSYDTYGNILTKTDALGNISSYTYDEFYNLQTETSAEGIQTEYVYDANNNKLQTEIIFGSTNPFTDIEYNILDKASKITQKISENVEAETQMSYDANENLIETIFPNGAKQQFTYDSYDRVITKSIIADGETNTTSNNYDGNGNIISQNANGELTQMSYDLFNRVILVTDALGNTSSYSYDKMGNIVETQVKNSSGALLSHTTMTYNQGNNLLSMTRQGASDSRTSLYTYDTAGNILSQTDSGGNIRSYSYDTLMRQTQETDPNGLISETSYDLGNRVISQSIIGDLTILTTTYTYDDDGRVISQSDSDGNTSSYSYNNLGQVIQMTDAKNIDTNYSYDYRGKLLSESREGKIISYQYDTIGNMIELTDANGNVTEYLYNEKGNRIKEIHDDGTQFIFSYDIEGKLISESEPNGNTRAYIYDALDRLATKNITQTGAVTGIAQENFSYDGLGRLESADNDLAVDIDFSYNLYGELISESQTTALGGTQTVSYSHDVLGNTTGLTYPSGSLLAQSYDTTSRLTGLVFDGEQILDINYNDLYKTSQTYGNTRATNYSYDTLGRLAGLGSKNYSYDTLGNMLSDGDDNYEYDTLNRLESMTYGSTPWENYTGRSYEYDFMGNRNKENLYYTNSKGKLKNRPVLYDTNTINGSTYRAYEKDIKKDFGTVTDWESRDGLAQTRGKQEYDASGNLIRKVVNANWSYIYHYDGNNRLIQVDNESHIEGEAITSTVLTAYTYDPLGRRVQKLGQSNRTILYTYAGQQAIEERTYGGASPTPFSQKQLIFTDQIDELIATYNTTLSTGTTTLYYYESDHLGSIESVYDATSGLVETYEYDVFGNVISRDATGTKQKIKNATSSNTRLYTGREYDQEINLYYNRARYYDSQMGKFISRDPIGIADDVNLYSYVGNSPVMFVDRFGREKRMTKYTNLYTAQAIKTQILNQRMKLFPTQNNLSELIESQILEKKYLNEIGKINSYRNNYLKEITNLKEIEEFNYIKQKDKVNKFHRYTLYTDESLGNIKYLSPDKHQEVIYNKYSGEFDYSALNGATYNYGTTLSTHTILDVLPYYYFGNSSNDPTTINQRVLQTFK